MAKASGAGASYYAGVVTGAALGAAKATAEGVKELAVAAIDVQLAKHGDVDAMKRTADRGQAIAHAVTNPGEVIDQYRKYTNREETGARREENEGNWFTAGVARGVVAGEALSVAVPTAGAVKSAATVGAKFIKKGGTAAAVATAEAGGTTLATDARTITASPEAAAKPIVEGPGIGPATTGGAENATGMVAPELAKEGSAPKFVYRAGPKTDMNLTPRPSDTKGLSTFDTAEEAFANSPSAKKAQVIDTTKLKTLCATCDSPPGHVSIAPTTPKELAEWAATRGTKTVHPLTDEMKSAVVKEVPRE